MRPTQTTTQEFRTKAEMQSSTMVAVDDLMDVLPRIGEPLREVEVCQRNHSIAPHFVTALLLRRSRAAVRRSLRASLHRVKMAHVGGERCVNPRHVDRAGLLRVHHPTNNGFKDYCTREFRSLRPSECALTLLSQAGIRWQSTLVGCCVPRFPRGFTRTIVHLGTTRPSNGRCVHLIQYPNPTELSLPTI